MPLMSGTCLGAYEIVSLLGAGGMGEVYRARDPRLGRDVAIKILPAGVASDPERLTRFEQEAPATAALNHPNILAVYEVGSVDGVAYVVSELLDGETLRETLRHGAVGTRQAIEQYAVSRDGQRFLMMWPVGDQQAQLRVILNWPSLVPAK